MSAAFNQTGVGELSNCCFCHPVEDDEDDENDEDDVDDVLKLPHDALFIIHR